FVAHAMFLSGALVAAGATRLHRDYLQFSSRPETSPLPATINLCVIVLLISATITIIYYVLIGYNVVILMLEGSLAFGDYSDLRLASYSGEEYFAPGYVNQFKNVLLPLT